MKVIFATTNIEKVEEAKVALQPFGYEVERLSFDFNEPYEGTMEDIAKIKLNQILAGFEVPVIVDDSGIFFEAYKQFPGILSKRIFKIIGYKGIEKLLKDEIRSAFFYGVIAVKWRGNIEIFVGKTRGTIRKDFPRLAENLQFPYDPIFIPEGETRVLADMSIEERVQYSYRRIALEKLGAWLKEVESKSINVK